MSFVKSAGFSPGRIVWKRCPLEIWTNVLETMANDGVLDALFIVVYADAQSTGLREVIDRLRAGDPPVPANLDAYSLPLLPQSRAFLDRAALRANLQREFGNPDGARVLLVRGGHGLGKSHSWYLINYVGYKTRSFTAYRFDFSYWSGPPRTSQEVFAEICQQLRWQIPQVDPTAQPDAVVRLLVSAFKGLARDRLESTCLVFDGFTEQTTDDWARRLVIDIAAAANDGEAGGTRVVLLDVDATLTGNLALEAVSEELTEARLEHLTCFFQSAAKAVGETVDKAGMNLLVEQVLGTGPHPGKFPLATVGPMAAKVAAAAFGGAL